MTNDRSSPEFADYLLDIATVYPEADTIHLVLDNFRDSAAVAANCRDATPRAQIAVGTTRKRGPRWWPSASGAVPIREGQPGYLRVDTVHQGDAPAGQGVYHINAVDQVTQWEIVAATERIREAWLEPVLCALLRQFPFRILGFHSDNGSEFIHRVVARLLNKLLLEQTKSRPRHSNDHGLAETKNGTVIRKHIGYGYIPAGHAGLGRQSLQHNLCGWLCNPARQRGLRVN